MIIGFLDYVRFEPLDSKGMKIAIFFRNHNYIIAHKKSVATNEKQCNSVVLLSPICIIISLMHFHYKVLTA